MKIELGSSWGVKLQSRIGRYQFEVGILDDKAHRQAKETTMFETPDLGTYAGGPVRKTTRQDSEKTIGQVFVDNMQRLNIDLLREPFRQESSEIMKFTRAFLDLVTYRKAMTMNRVENLLQAVVRNPILRQDYGPNRPSTADAKGFDRHLIDTAQLFKAIRARAKRV